MENLRVLLDRLEQAQRGRTATGGPPSTPSSSAPLIPGLRFQRGDKVLDLANGRKGTVIDGVRDDATGQQAYTVQLVTGQTVFRGLGELGADVQPISPANR